MDFLSRLIADPRKAIDGASVTRVDELGNGWDDFGQLIAPKFEQPQQTWGETALGVATAPARLATALAGSLSPYGQDGWQVPPAAQEGWNALTAVGDAYTQGMSEDEMRNRALGMAGFMMGGGGAAMALERSLPQAGVSLGDRVMAKYLDWKHPDEPSAFNNARKLKAMQTGARLDTKTMVDQTRLDPRIADDARYNDLVRRSFERFGKHYEALSPDETRVIRDGVTNRASFDVIDGRLYSNASKEGAIPALLDMGQEARLARAREMGFDTSRTLYPSKSDSANLLAANADSRPALLGAGQEQIDPERLKAIIRARMRGEQ